MSGSVASTVPVCTIDATGIHAPSIQDILTYLVGQAQTIYGQDIYLDSDSPDGQMLGVFAAAINDANNMAVAVYNSFSPSTAQGAGLSSVVKINGISRDVPTNSQAQILIGGTVGTTITNGVVGDSNQNQWNLPSSVTIPSSGQTTVTATCATAGAIQADPGTITDMLTPTRGWSSATNPTAATVGQPVETDSQLRLRQAQSTELPAQTPLEAVVANVGAVTGVARVKGYENDNDIPDSNGLPGHSIAIVVDGGDAQAVANAIALKKNLGTTTYGTTSETYIDSYGNVNTINFFEVSVVPITVVLDITPLSGYTDVIGQEIIAAVVAAINALPIGQSVLNSRLYVPANLAGPSAAPALPTDSLTYELNSITITRQGQAPATDVTIAFNEAASCATSNVTLNT